MHIECTNVTELGFILAGCANILHDCKALNPVPFNKYVLCRRSYNSGILYLICHTHIEVTLIGLQDSLRRQT